MWWKAQQGWYCVGLRRVQDDAPRAEDRSARFNRRPLEWRDEAQPVFSRLSRFIRLRSKLGEPPGFSHQPPAREVENFVPGLRDSRSPACTCPGVPVPGHAITLSYVCSMLAGSYGLLEPGDPADLDLRHHPRLPAHVSDRQGICACHASTAAMLLSAGLDAAPAGVCQCFLTREGPEDG